MFKLLEQIARVVTSDTRDQQVHGSNPDISTSVFSRDMAGTCISLLLPNDTGAPCLEEIHIVHSLN